MEKAQNPDRSNWHLLIAFLCFLHLCLLPAGRAFAEDVKRVALAPFTVHSKDNKENLQEALMKALTAEIAKQNVIQLADQSTVDRLAGGKPVDERLAARIGKETNAQYVVIGSISEFGDRISIDVMVYDVQQNKTLPGYFTQGRGIESIAVTMAPGIKNDLLLKTGVEKKIVSIEFKGNQKIENTAISQVIKSAKGAIFSNVDLSNDIKAIYKMGYFDDVRADIADVPEGKTVTFILSEKALIADIKIQGNKKLDTDEIKAAMTVKPRQILNPEKLKADVEKIKGLYENKGYYNAEITTSIEKEGTKDPVFVVKIVENDRLYVRRISFEGNKAFRDKDLKNMMKTSEWYILSFITDAGLLKKDELRQDIGKLNTFYLNNGYINAQIGEPEITHDQKGIYIKIPISEGRQFKVGKVDITGDELKTPRAELLTKLSIKQKDYYDRSAIMKDIEELTRITNDEGYANADVTPRTNILEKDTAVDITYHITKGKPVYFNRITITGNYKTRDKVIRRALSVVEGDLYNSTGLKKSYQSLERTRYFEEINFQAEKGPDETLTDVNIQVKEKQTGMFSIGAGYSASDNASITAHVQQQNLFGRAQTLSLRATLSSYRRLYEISFIEPWLFDIPLWTKTDLWNIERQYDTYTLEAIGFGVTFGYPLWEYFYGTLGYRLSNDTVKDIQSTASSYTKSQEGTTITSSITAGINRDTTNDNMFPSQGSRNSVSMTYAGGFLQGDSQFTRYGATSFWFFPMPLETVFSVGGRIGYIASNNDKPIPVYERYYLGGINSLRGLRNVGPKDPATGEFIGGLTMMSYTAEFIFPLMKSAGLKGVVFYDTGNSWESGYHFDNLRKTCGLGVRWYSPIGPLRLEWGYVLDKQEGDEPFRWEFTMGMMM
ncbi:MAG: outer membrane protein assembly factor BamA [Syntrophaceae bacterium]|nr:outer membrane protein assembly factor BamA [Syntrophaceae bacterium]